MCQDLGRDVLGLEKLYARKLRADFSYPKNDYQTEPYYFRIAFGNFCDVITDLVLE